MVSEKTTYYKCGLLSAIFFVTLLFGLLVLSACSTDSNSNDESIDPNGAYSIKYDGNGHTEGNVPIDPLKYMNGNEVMLMTKATLAKDGFIFDGWNTKQDGTGENFEEQSSFQIASADIVFYAQWLNEIVYHELISSNVSIIDILNVVPLPAENWYHATVDVVNGTLTLNDGPSSAKLQFQYNGPHGVAPENKGYLRVDYSTDFHTASDSGRAIALSKGSGISSVTFIDAGIAEISGLNHNWADTNNGYIPVSLLIDGKTHYGYIEVSFKDSTGQLTIHATAYNMVAEKVIVAGQTDE